jgi:hypothetical protein
MTLSASLANSSREPSLAPLARLSDPNRYAGVTAGDG